MRELQAAQTSHGGWSDIPSMESTSYATSAYERGAQFLLSTQQEDGSWHVKTRSLAFQPYFEAGFPHGFDQWISAAGTSWATMALALSPQPGSGIPTR